MFLDDLLCFNVTTLLMLFHRQHDHIVSLSSWMTCYPRKSFSNKFWIFFITWNDKAMNDVGHNGQSLMLWFNDLFWLSESLKGSFKNDSHIEIKIEHFKEHTYPSNSTVVLVINWEKERSSDDKDPVYNVDWGDKVLVLLISVKIRDIHRSTSLLLF